ncbi:MAG: SUMF1/EgtB/PvdO family nonheme iron enzyme [Planctomycetia bacterium]|nr:SUMF1/EgtB/PvdO family nonheme iron enzyme [Planctomycetia bacterium]
MKKTTSRVCIDNVHWTLFLPLTLLVMVFFDTINVPGAEKNDKTYTMRAVWFDEGNVKATSEYGQQACIINNGQYPNRAEYRIQFPESGRYALSILYAAFESRPTEIYLDGQKLADATAGTTGDWSTETAQWECVTEFEISQGEHTIAITRPDACIPHIVALRLEPQFEMNANWQTPREIIKSFQQTRLTTTAHAPGDWFWEVADDRAAKQESGLTFTDHFGNETITALVPQNELTFTIIEKPDVTPAEIDLNNELDYRPEMFVQTPPEDENKFIVRVSRTLTDESPAKSILTDPMDFTITPARYRLLIEKCQSLLSRLTENFGREEIEELYGASLADLEQTLSTRSKTDFASVDKLEIATTFFDTIHKYATLARSNPLLDFDDLLFIRRGANDLGLVNNWVSNSAINGRGFDDALCCLKLHNKENATKDPEVIFKPEFPAFIGDMDLHFDAGRLLFSSVNQEGQWNIFETNLTRGDDDSLAASPAAPLLPYLPEANAYDGCYLPDDSIMYTSSACYISVPCVNGATRVTNMYRQYNDEQKTIRRLTFDQEHNWCPVVMEDGRVMYQRWEYADVPHAHARLLFLMNPDGTNQASFYGSNSYWPNAMFYARPIPEEPTKFVAVVGGHHGVSRMGELVLFDVKQGRKEAQGAVQRICGTPRIVASKTDPKYEDTLIVDCLVNESFPKFLHPYPLSSDYYLVSASLTPGDGWGIYLVDTDDNMILLSKEKGFANFEPVPLRATQRPPVIADRVDTTKEDATVFIADIYVGDGLKGVPRGTVKNLRLFTYNYLLPYMGGPQGCVGAEGPWDIRNTLGTVPVEPNGSAMFTVPANTPIAIQPLDENGKEIQLMRSWFTAMPGEVLSCIGCHEDQNSVSPNSLDPTLVQRMRATTIDPWYGPQRGFSFKEEVQPVLDRYCIACHDGSTDSNLSAFDLRGLDNITDYVSAYHTATRGGNWSTSYNILHRYVRRPGMESDYHLLMPTEFSAETTDLYRMLIKGHYGVQLDAESWDRILTWIDLNAPYHGYWHEQGDANNSVYWNRFRMEVMKLYKSGTEDQEVKKPTIWDANRAAATYQTNHSLIPGNPLDTGRQAKILSALQQGTPLPDGATVKAQRESAAATEPVTLDWSFDSPEAKRRQADEAKRLFGDASETTKIIECAPGLSLEFQLIPAGTFLMGAQSKQEDGTLLQPYEDESACVVEIPKAFWMSTKEITNGQFEIYDPSHDSRVESRYGMQFGVRGFHVNEPEKSVVRVSWNDANLFCQWLSQKSGQSIQLPTESQWEYACRAGTTSPLNYGDLDTDFAQFANLADNKLRDFVCHPYFKECKPMGGSDYDHWLPRDDRFNDGSLLSESPGRYAPNAWGLYDMHGNVAEWTRSLARPYPYVDNDGRNDVTNADEMRIVRGGSWRDRPVNARSEFRSFYRPWQGVFNVGFRVICNIE